LKVSTDAFLERLHTEAMRSAYYTVCDALLLKGDVDDPMTEIIVNKIVDLVKAGEHDADQLTQAVLNDLLGDGPPSRSSQQRQAPSHRA
jgi:hypothetical protein